MDLRLYVVEATSEQIDTGYQFQDRLAAQACFKLAKNYAEDYRYEGALDLQRAAILFCNQDTGPENQEMRQDRSITLGWKKLSRK